MKTLKFLIAFLFAGLVSTYANTNPSDTVVLELSNKSKIIIYTQDKESLKKIELYDLNRMIRDLNEALSSEKIEKLEILDESGEKYKNDTTIIIGDNPEKISIKIKNLEFLVDADNWEDMEDAIEDSFDDDQPYNKYEYEVNPEEKTQEHFYLDIGLNNWVDNGTFANGNEPYALRPFGSWYIALNSVFKTRLTKSLFLDWGGGVSWYNFRLSNSDYMISKGENNIEFIEAPSTYNTIKSRLSVPYVNIMAVPMIDFSHGNELVKSHEKGNIAFRSHKKQGIRFGVGPYLGYRIGGNTKFKYTENGDKQKDKESDNFYLNNLRYGLRAQFGFRGIDLFANYDLNEIFSTGRGPEGTSGLSAISFGFIF